MAVDGVKINLDVVSSSIMYIAPPLVAEQSVKEREVNVRFFDAGMLTCTPPPFPDVHLQESNPMLERDTSSSLTLVNSNTAPFPLERVMEVKVVVDVQESFSTSTAIRGVFVVVVDALDVNVIPSNSSVPDDTSINEASSVSVFFTSIVNAFSVTVFVPLEADTVKGVPALASD